MPDSKHFDLADVVRVQVVQTPDAQAAMNASSEQGRLLPQALAEDFALIAPVYRLELSLVLERDHFPQHPRDNSDAQVLVIDVISHVRPPVRFYLPLALLAQVHPNGPPHGFVAATCAYELVRLYPGRTHHGR